jgi:Carboxypeptidase regulatory-like domain/TonB dependent receptor
LETFVRAIFVALVFSVLLGSKALPQSPTASVTGVVFDPAGKVIPGAEIIAVNDLTRVQYEAKTNGDGIYTVVSLPPGPYRIQVSKVDFKTIIKPDIILNVGDALSLNFTLEIGASSVVVTVEGGAPMINTTDATVSTVVDRQFAENLPLNGRSFQTLIDLAPGVVVAAVNSADNGQFNVNGQRAAANYWMVDGVSANIGIGVSAVQAGGNGLGGTLGSFSSMGGTNSLVSVDALQEFRIQTSTYSPEFGRTPGGQISIVTRSGTNQFHGTAFDYVRNDVLDANNWFADSVGLAKPKEGQNDFGGTVGGPILKDRTFFFFSYEGLRLNLPETSLTTVPDSAARQNAVAAMQPYLNAFPKPNGADEVASGIGQFNASYSDPATLDAYSLRIDHHPNERWSLFGRYNYSPSKIEDRGASGESPLSTISTSIVNTQTATVGATWSPSANVASDLRFNYSRVSAQNWYSDDGFGGAVPLETLPFPQSFDARNGNFSLSIYSLTTGGELSQGALNCVLQRQLNLVDSLSVQKGSHSLKFGADFRTLIPLLAPVPYHQVVNFNDVALAETGSATSGRIGSALNPTLLFRNFSVYAQDIWHVRPGLTLTYGLRWDLDFAPDALDGPNIPAVTGYSPNDFSKLAIAPVGTAPFDTTYGNVAPRFGIAYQLRQSDEWQTVVRGGFGVFYDLVSSEAGNLLASRFPPLGDNFFLRNTAFPYTAAQSAAPPIPPNASLAYVQAFNPHLQLPYTLEWNVAVEQSLGNNQALSVSYLGAAGRRLLQTTAIANPPSNPLVSGLFADNTASSDYNALQVQFRRRLSRGLQVLSSYTLAHSIDDASAGSGFNGVNDLPGTNASVNRASSDFDIRHTFTAGLTYDVPAPEGNLLLRTVLRDWSLESIILARSAPPVDLTDINFYGFDSGFSANVRPDVILGMPLYLYGAGYPGGKAFNPAAFEDPPVDPVTGNPLRQGDLPRNTLRAFGATQWDFALHRDFRLSESWKLQFRAEMFNVLNHPNFAPPNPNFGEAGFGLSSETLGQYLSGGAVGGGGLSPLYQIGGPRSIQLALKLMF